MTTTDPTTTSTSRPGRRARLLGVGAATFAVAAFAFVLVFGGRNAVPSVAPDPTGGTMSASCVELYSPASLARRAFAFDGKVTRVDGDRVTFAVNESFHGPQGDSITLDAPGMTGNAITSAGGPNLAVGERYLVAGDSTFAWSCGFTQPYDATVAAEWSAAFGG